MPAQLDGTALMWFRNDLRVHDNEALLLGNRGTALLCVYVFDERQFYAKSRLGGYPRIGPHRAYYIRGGLARRGDTTAGDAVRGAASGVQQGGDLRGGGHGECGGACGAAGHGGGKCATGAIPCGVDVDAGALGGLAVPRSQPARWASPIARRRGAAPCPPPAAVGVHRLSQGRRGRGRLARATAVEVS
eukprot:ctg_377.g237